MWMTRISRRPAEQADALARRIVDELATHNVVWLTDVDPESVDLRSFYDGLCDSLGAPFYIDEDSITGERTGERWISIRYDESMPDRYRHAPVAQPLHTDYAYTPDNPELALLYCENRAPEGGATIFMDGTDVVTALSEREPELFEELTQRAVRFSKADMEKLDHVISKDEEGPLLTWLYTCVDPGQESEVLSMTSRFASFVEEHLTDSDSVARLRLAPGEAAIWRDRRLLHGREAFAATKNDDRLLWKTGVYLR